MHLNMVCLIHLSVALTTGIFLFQKQQIPYRRTVKKKKIGKHFLLNCCLKTQAGQFSEDRKQGDIIGNDDSVLPLLTN